MTRPQPFIFARISPPEACPTAARGAVHHRTAPKPATSAPLPLVGRDGVGGTRPIHEAKAR